jgi:hypothetical protein
MLAQTTLFWASFHYQNDVGKHLGRLFNCLSPWISLVTRDFAPNPLGAAPSIELVMITL